MITGYITFDCPFCRANQAFLHLHIKAPCIVRCGRCGARGPEAKSPSEAVRRWNGYARDVANSVRADVAANRKEVRDGE